jgi:phage shock protein A
VSAFNRLLRTLRDEFAGLGDDLRGTGSFGRIQDALDEEIRAAHAQLQGWRDELAALKARRFTCKERVDAHAAAIRELEAAAIKALSSRKPSLAREHAEAIARAESGREQERLHARQLDMLLGQLRETIEHGESRLRRLKQQLDIVRTTQGILSAQAEVARRGCGGDSCLRTALESVERIRMRKAGSLAANTGDRHEEAPLPVGERADQVLVRLRRSAAAQARKTVSDKTRTRAKG